jgi:hypothetical protein
MKIKLAGKILGFITILLAEDLFFNEQKDHIPDILTLLDPPLTHQSRRHRAKLLERQVPETRQQLRTADMPRLPTVSLRHPLQGEVQSILEEKKRMRVIPLISLQDGNHRLFKLHRMHGTSLSADEACVKARSELPVRTKAA